METLKIQLLGLSIVNGGGKRRHGRGVARISFQCRDCGGVGMHQLNTSGTGLNKAGVGGPGVPPIGPAVANAMARLGLERPRRLPMMRRTG
jgi:hypothetical protein